MPNATEIGRFYFQEKQTAMLAYEARATFYLSAIRICIDLSKA